ncbi:hypothetical protein SpCBS45565_g05572 [Spizellomyces sp. 'palustris']|nr:hypothetical protein SpCBS45565_g05572 [Spizellomyces sp. 'palustris']
MPKFAVLASNKCLEWKEGFIITSFSSSDSTIRLWDIEHMQDRIALTCPKDTVAQSISFDYCGDMITAITSAGVLVVYDPRASTDPVYTAQADHVASKPCRTYWLAPDPTVVTTGFNKQSAREIAVWDTRSLQKPVQVLETTGTGVGVLQPFWDPALPLVYFGSKGEGIRVYELMEGTLKYVNAVKVEKQATAVELLPKSLCDSRKCEIARFLRLGTDNAVETTSIYVPRVDGEKTFQADLYPPIPIVNPAASSHQWFDAGDSIEPMMVDVVAPEPVQVTVISTPDDEDVLNFQSKGSGPTVEELLLQRRDTLRRQSTQIRRAPTAKSLSISRSSSGASLSALASTQAETSQATSTVYLDGTIDIERRGWFGSVWERHYLSLKKSRLYVSLDQDAEMPLYFIPLASIRKLDVFTLGQDRGDGSHHLGLVIETSERVWRFKAGSKPERDMWLNTLTSLLTVQGSLGVSSAPLPALPKKESQTRLAPRSSTLVVGNREGASLIGHIQCLISSGPNSRLGKSTWTARFAVLDEEGLLHLYPSDIKAYTDNKPPLESFNLSAAISVRLADLSSDTSPLDLHADCQIHTSNLTCFQINTTKRKLLFRSRNAHESANWVLQIRRVVVSKGFVPAKEIVSDDVLEGWVDVKSGGERVKLAPRRYWLEVIDGTFYYFDERTNTSASCVIPASAFDDVSTEAIVNASGAPQVLDTASFVLHFIPDVTCIHGTSSIEKRNAWVDGLSHIRMASYDLLGRIGLNTDNILRDEVAKAKADEQRGVDLKDEVDRVVFVDETRIEKGEQKVLIGVYGKVKLVISGIHCTVRSLKADGAFVLDVGMTIYHWNGPASSRVCRARAMDVATRIRKLRANRPRVLLVEPDDRELMTVFFNHLGASLPIQSPFPPSDENISALIRVFKIVDSDLRRRKVKLIYQGGSPSRRKLESEKVFVVLAASEVFLWIGCKAGSEERALGSVVAKRAAGWIRNSLNEGAVLVRKEYEARESAIWKEKFIDYEGSLPISMRIDVETKGNIAPTLEQPPIPIPSLLARSPLPAHLTVLPETTQSGRLSIYRVENFVRHPVSTALHGQFFRSESYVSLYSYRPPTSGVEKCISYFWQGGLSSVTQKGTSALMTIELSDGIAADVQHIRVAEGKEPKHLCLLFGELGFVIRLGSPPGKQIAEAHPLIFEIRECYEGICKAIETEFADLILNSNHCYIILFPEISYIWTGQHSVLSERTFAERVAQRYCVKGTKHIAVKETDILPKAMQDMLSQHHVSIPPTTNLDRRYLARLFSCSSGSGVVQIEEIPLFVQEDLDPNIVHILDTFSTIFVWFGTSAKVNEKIIGMESALLYLEQSTLHDKQRTALLVTFAHQEPADFTKHFHGWTRQKIPKDKRDLPKRTRPLPEVLAEYKRATYPLEVLLSEQLPEHLDPTKLEMYLSEEDFEALFKMQKGEYVSLQPWKREKVKKQVGVF